MPALQKHALVLALAGLWLGPAQAAAELAAEFRDPTGTVASSDSINVTITLRSVGDQPFLLAPGDSMDIALYTLAPTGGSAAAGSYRAYSMGVGLKVYGLATDGLTELEADVLRAATCAGQSQADCSFTRMVLAPVPEPATLLMLLSGLAALGFAVQGRRGGV